MIPFLPSLSLCGARESKSRRGVQKYETRKEWKYFLCRHESNYINIQAFGDMKYDGEILGKHYVSSV